VLPYSRHLDSAMAGGRPKKCSALTPAPSPKGPGRPLFYSAAVSFGPRLRDSSLEPVILAGRPHLVEYDRQFAGQRNLGLCQASPFRQAHGPRFKGAPPFAVVE
jgi:hypothetical protein